MIKVLRIITGILMIVSMMGCISNEEKNKSESSFLTIKGNVVYTTENIYGVECEIVGKYTEKDFVFKSNYLKIIKQKGENTIVSIVSSDKLIKGTEIFELPLKDEAKIKSSNVVLDNPNYDKKGVITLTGDFDFNGDVNLLDFSAFIKSYGTVSGENEYANNCDIFPTTPDGKIDLRDFVTFAQSFGKYEKVTINNLIVEKEKVCVVPGEKYPIIVSVPDSETQISGLKVVISLTDISGNIIKTYNFDNFFKSARYELDTTAIPDGGYIPVVEILRGQEVIGKINGPILSVVTNVAADIRYGFYTKWNTVSNSYDNKAKAFADMNINAVEYYDYFPAHGKYAPTENDYYFEPFNTHISGIDISGKMKSLKTKNVRSIAYVSAYAASKSIIEINKETFTMRSNSETGDFKVFGAPGEIRNESNFSSAGDKWFWLTAIHRNSDWYKYIMEEFKRALDDSPNDLVSFDGFELDTYSDDSTTRYYAKNGGSYNGWLLKDVMKEFIGDVRTAAHNIKSDSMVSYNCVNEAGIENMYDVNDFIFIEIWPSKTVYVNNLIDICSYHRSKLNQRVVLKLYPYQMSRYSGIAKDKVNGVWPVANLKYIMGATMTGGGSFMTAGEPDDNGKMSYLNTEYYPQFLQADDQNIKIMKDYYAYDTLLYGVAHGKNVSNVNAVFTVPSGLTVRTVTSDKGYFVLNILNSNGNPKWTDELSLPPTMKSFEIKVNSYNGQKPTKVLYGSPDSAEYSIPKELSFDYTNGVIKVNVPELQVFGTLIIKY